MASHRPNRQRIKIHRPYTVDQAARTLGVAKGTVRRWIKAGLATINDKKPALVLGTALVAFLTARKRPRQTCKPHECYCVRCRTPQPVAGGMAEFVKLTASFGNLRGICPACGTMMHKTVGKRVLALLQGDSDLSISVASSRLVERAVPSLIEHFPTEANTHG
jgi:hypothetical protein